MNVISLLYMIFSNSFEKHDSTGIGRSFSNLSVSFAL